MFHLNCFWNFLEYCSSRAVPNLLSSDYLNTLGAKLLKDIDILWTGNLVLFSLGGNNSINK